MPYAIARDGTRLHYRVHDCTRPWSHPSTLILQHGFARSSEFWRGMVPALSRHYRVVCPDLRGLGESGATFDPDHALSIPTYLDDLIAVMDHLGCERIHYGGESFGGMLGVHFAVEHAARLSSLCLMSTPPAPVFGARETFPCFGHDSWQHALREMGPGEWSRAANSATRFPPDTDPALVEWFVEQGARCSVDVLVAMSRVIEQVDLKHLLPRIRVPVLGLYPTLAKTVTEEQMSLLRQIPNLRLVTMPIRFHMVWAMRPHACAMNLLAFLAQLDGFDCFD